MHRIYGWDAAADGIGAAAGIGGSLLCAGRLLGIGAAAGTIGVSCTGGRAARDEETAFCASKALLLDVWLGNDTAAGAARASSCIHGNGPEKP